MKSPRITVCIVVFNGGPHIANALDSVLNQDYPELELVVIDGGSTDGTVAVLSGYAERISQIVSEPDLGIYDAMNKACAIAQGDWLMFLGCDDILLDSLSTVASRLRDGDTVYYGNVVLRSNGSVYGGPFSKYRMMQSNICHQAIFYPKKIYQTNSYTLKYRFLADHEYNIRLIGRGVKFEFVDVDTAIFNDTGASLAGDADFERDKLRLIRDNFGLSWAILKRLRTMAAPVIKPLIQGQHLRGPHASPP